MGASLQDLRFALGNLGRAPAFPLATVATPALAAGTTAGCILLISVTLSGAQDQRTEAGRVAFERIVRELAIFGPSQFLYGFRQDLQGTDAAPAREFFEIVERRDRTANDFRQLLPHPDPKVRTLALIALYLLDDPTVLPDIFRFVRDDAETFRALVPVAAMARIGGANPTEKQTVGAIATRILQVYLESGGYLYGPSGGREPGFEAYWKTHAQRSSSAGWWTVRLARASHATSPTPRDRIDPIRQLRARIDALPEPDRTFVLLWLNGDAGSDVLVSTDELIALSKQLGSDTLLKILERRILSDDPDLQPRPSNNYAYARMCLFILQNATSVLRPTDASVLLARERWERDHEAHNVSDPLITPWWAIAAAALNDRETVSILRRAHERFDGQYDGEHRLELAHALCELTGNEQIPAVVDWFYQELTHPPLSTFALPSALTRLLAIDHGRDRFLRTLIEDSRFDSLSWKSLEVLARAMNATVGRPLISEEEMARVSWPDFDLFVQDIPARRRLYPEQTAVLVEILTRWRRILREAVR
jgi:hypothetical protein